MKVGVFVFKSMEQFLCFPAGSNITDNDLKRLFGMVEYAFHTSRSLVAAFG
jgi:hypothetical protein